jgi:hypothetical protein
MPPAAQVAAKADQDSSQGGERRLLIKCCRTVLTERCRYITK